MIVPFPSRRLSDGGALRLIRTRRCSADRSCRPVGETPHKDHAATAKKAAPGSMLGHSDPGKDTSTAGPGRWRSKSEASTPPVRPKLFRSVREAMEFETSHEALVTDGSPTLTLGLETLSILEASQADEAGYTVIRQLAVSDPSDSQDERRPHSNRTGKSQTRHGSERSRKLTETRPVATTKGRRPKKMVHLANPATPGNPWSTPALSVASDVPSTPAAGSTSACQVHERTMSSSKTHSSWHESKLSLPTLPAASTSVSVPEPATLDESMLSWLENTLTREMARNATQPTPDDTAATGELKDLAPRHH